MLERALAMSIEDSSSSGTGSSSQAPDFSAMTEDEQIAFALRMSMQDAIASRKCTMILILTYAFSRVIYASKRCGDEFVFFFLLLESSSGSSEEKKEESKPAGKDEEMEIDYAMETDTAYLQNVLERLPGVNPDSEEAKAAGKDDSSKDKDKKKETKKWMVYFASFGIQEISYVVLIVLKEV